MIPQEKTTFNTQDALRILFSYGQVVEMRVPKVDGRRNRTDAGYFDDMALLDKAATHYSGKAGGVYATLNPVNPALLARAANRVEQYSDLTTSDNDILCRRWLPIDVDPVRPAGISSTNEEHDLALARVERIADWLSARRWPKPLIADSGNGGHLLYRIDLPNDTDSTALVQRCLQALSMLWDNDQATVDTGNYNAARIWKVYDTLAAKGDNTPERPHRLARLLSIPDAIETVTLEQLQELAAMLPQEEPEHSRRNGYTGSFDLARWISDHNIDVGQSRDWNGGKRWVFNTCPWNSDHTDRSAFIVQLGNGAIAAGCHHNGCQGQNWHTLREMIEGPKTYTNGTGPKAEDTGKKDEGPKKDSAPKSERLITAVQGLGRDLRLNSLEDNVEIDGQRLDDITLSEINLKLIDQGFSRADIADAVNVLAGRNRYHPVRDYLLGLQWNGENHVGKFVSHLTGDGTVVKYGSIEKPLHSALIVRWLLGCVARALTGDQENAFKHQTPMLVIIGPQGVGKSTLVRWWASGVGYAFHRESMLNPHSIDDQRSMVTKWIWEVSELSSSLRKADRDSLKAFITQEWHTYRKPYGKHPITKSTLCNLVGTLNPETGFLDDPTGHRRFLPVVLKRIDHGYKDKIDINQLWAQLVHMYQSGESPELLPNEIKAVQSTYAEHEVENPLETYIHMYFDVEPGNADMRCHTASIMDRLKAFGVDLPRDPRVAGRALNDVLSPMGLQRSKFRLDGTGAAWGWIGIQPNDRAEPTK